MMQRWMTVALLGATLAGCEMDQPTAAAGQITQAQTQPQDQCAVVDLSGTDPTLPKSVLYNGQAIPKGSADTIWVIMPLDPRGLAQAAQVNTVTQQVVVVYDLPKGEPMGEFMTQLTEDNAGQAVYPGHPNPPPPLHHALDFMAYATGGAQGNVSGQFLRDLFTQKLQISK